MDKITNTKSQPLLYFSESWLSLISTVEKAPTLSAGRKILLAAKAAHYRRPQSLGDMVLTDRRFATDIAQCQLGDLAFKVRYTHCTYSSVFVKTLWDI